MRLRDVSIPDQLFIVSLIMAACEILLSSHCDYIESNERVAPKQPYRINFDNTVSFIPNEKKLYTFNEMHLNKLLYTPDDLCIRT